eukprot:Rhum_TRINITY_DN23020_c0_g1::Rhum_TRINITY_DN23020_c0_g1_i1::g.176876::m.176876
MAAVEEPTGCVTAYKRLADFPGVDASGPSVFECEGDDMAEIADELRTEQKEADEVGRMACANREGDVVVEASLTSVEAVKRFDLQKAEKGCGVGDLRALLALGTVPGKASVDLEALHTQLRTVQKEALEMLSAQNGSCAQPQQQQGHRAAASADPQLLKTIQTLEADIGTSVMQQPLFAVVSSLSQRTAYLEPATLKSAVERLSKVAELMQAAIDAPSASEKEKLCTNVEELAQRVEEFKRHENTADSIPAVVDRLIALQPLHDRAEAVALQVRQTAAMREHTATTLKAVDEVVTSLSEQLPETGAQIAKNTAGFEERMDRLAKNIALLEKAG